MEISAKKDEKGTLVTVKGRMDAVTSPEFEKDLNQRISDGEFTFISDFSERDYISSTGLRSILATAKRLKAENGRIMLASLKDVVKEVFEISGFSSIIPIYESVDAARDEL